MVISLEYQNIKTFLQKAIFQTDLTKFLRLKKLITLVLGHILLVILKFRVEKVIKKKSNKLKSES